ncbi:hypothetical protein EI94DRAFT_1705396 [Lactarius quietus]|nr:hypothetical protein EI94DRAFT_1705396 [Lactarius quietus]
MQVQTFKFEQNRHFIDSSPTIVLVGLVLITQPISATFLFLVSYVRALYAEIIPAGEEARWSSLFSIIEEVPVRGRLVTMAMGRRVPRLPTQIMVDKTGWVEFRVTYSSDTGQLEG